MIHAQHEQFDDALLACLAKKRDLWSDFVRDPALQILASARQTQFTLLCLSLCFLILSSGAWWRSWQLDSQRQGIRDEQIEIFEEAFPGQRVPNAVLRRMKSELAKARGARTPQDEIELPTRSIAIIRDIVSALPATGETSVQELRVNKQGAILTLHIPAHEVAASIADRLRNAKFTVAPPTTETLRDTVRATITLSYSEGV